MERWEAVRAWKLRELPDPPSLTVSELCSKLSETGPNGHRTPQPHWEIKARVRLRDLFRCALCPAGRLDTLDGATRWRARDGRSLKRPPGASIQDAAARHLDVHHVVPRANGGSNDLSNLLTLCSACHRDIHDYRIDRIPRERTRPPLGTEPDGGTVRVG
ncbi:HNH endonuclease [Halorubrum vacuolatum]|uniref:HNH endonuclease n=1 Tax=Halorubrum vacuolatum TaxID=63740 RepID=A0A238X578_HALVU|nr:HNH endonuclease signature motif containing protein [Halorubrum vacuolatum]SNR53792.1 HNH endonuclease [Halorubrum vacuolatum]